MATITPALNELREFQLANRRWLVRALAGLVVVNGIVAILEAIYTRLPLRLEMLAAFDYDLYGRYFGLIAGFLLLYFASQLLLRKRLAWWMTFGGTAIIALGQGLYVRDPAGIILPVITLLVLAAYKDQFNVRAELHSVVQGLRLLLLCGLVALAYGTVGFTRLPERDFVVPHHAGIAEGADRTLEEFFLIGNNDLSPHSRRAQWFINSLDLLGGTSIIFAFYSLFRPLSYRYRTLPADRDRARRLLERYGTSSEDEFKVWPEDKAYFFGTGDEAFLAYRVEYGAALVLGEPVGPISAWPTLLERFKDFCAQHDWIVAFIYIPRTNLKMFEGVGLRPLKIGEDAIVETTQFVADTLGEKHFRGVINKFARLGYHFEVTMPPQSGQVLAECNEITRKWLAETGRRENTFALGYHDRGYLQRSVLYHIHDESGRIVAFANGVRSHNPAQATIDLMRYLPGTETGVMDFLLSRIVCQLHEADVAEFSLGMAPLSGVGEGPNQTLEERTIALIGRSGVGGFSYEGLRRFKNKFAPRWEPRYLVYERGPAGLTRALLAINKILGA